MEKIIADFNVHDAVAADTALRLLIERCQAAGLIEFITTPVIHEQLKNIPQRRNIGQATAIKAKRQGSAVFVPGVSKLSEDRLGTGPTNSAFHRIKKGNPKDVADAMIGATAVSDADILVTNDIKFRRRVEAILAPGLTVKSAAELSTHLTRLLAAFQASSSGAT